jgi:hypothetical protein
MAIKDDDGIHLCPICHVVEMEFLERIPSKRFFRMRRFKCPVCEHTELYFMGGPNDKKTAQEKRDSIRKEKFYNDESIDS